MPKPKAPPPAPEDRKLALDELKAKYSRVFGSIEGQDVLDDLQAQFGFRDGIELKSYQPQMSANDVIARDAAKQGILYIFRMLGAKLDFYKPAEKKPE